MGRKNPTEMEFKKWPKNEKRLKFNNKEMQMKTIVGYRFPSIDCGKDKHRR